MTLGHAIIFIMPILGGILGILVGKLQYSKMRIKVLFLTSLIPPLIWSILGMFKGCLLFGSGEQCYWFGFGLVVFFFPMLLWFFACLIGFWWSVNKDNEIE